MYFVTYHISFHCNIAACNPVSSGIPHSLWCCVIDIPWPCFLVSRGKMTVDQCCTVTLFLLLTSLPPSLHFLLPISLSLSISPPPSLPPSDYVLDDFVAHHQLDAEHREKVRVALLQRHKHQNTKDHDNKFLEHIK